MFFYVPPLGYSEIKTTWLVNENENNEGRTICKAQTESIPVTICKAQTESIRHYL